MAEVKVGDMVETCVFVLGERIPMAHGRVVAIHGGYCDVDVMSHHGGRPWIRQEMTHNLRIVERNTNNA